MSLPLNGFGFPVQDSIVLGVWHNPAVVPQASPGLCQIRGANSPRTYQKNRPAFLNGASLIYTGSDLSEFEVEFTLYDRKNNPADWDTFAKAFLQKPEHGKPPKVLTIQHPILNRAPLGISRVVVTDVSQLEPQDTGAWTVVVKFSEYQEPNPISPPTPEPTPGVPDDLQDDDSDPPGIRAKKAHVRRQLVELDEAASVSARGGG